MIGLVNIQIFFLLFEFATWHFRSDNVNLVQCTKYQWYIVVMLFVPVNLCQDSSLSRLHHYANTPLSLSLVMMVMVEIVD